MMPRIGVDFSEQCIDGAVRPFEHLHEMTVGDDEQPSDAVRCVVCARGGQNRAQVG